MLTFDAFICDEEISILDYDISFKKIKIELQARFVPFCKIPVLYLRMRLGSFKALLIKK